MMPFAWSAGAELTDADGAEYTLDSPEMVEGLELLQQLLRRRPLVDRQARPR